MKEKNKEIDKISKIEENEVINKVGVYQWQKKIIVIIFSVLIFNTCMGMTTKQYSYQTDKKDNTINIVGQLIDENNEYSFLDYFEISDGRNKKNIKHRIKLVNNKIKIIKDNREYIIPYSKSQNDDDEYLYIDILKNGVNITDDEFVVYLGKIELDTGEIIKLPPLHFKKYVYITKGSILNTINPNGKFNQYYNTVEEYKKNGWKEE